MIMKGYKSLKLAAYKRRRIVSYCMKMACLKYIAVLIIPALPILAQVDSYCDGSNLWTSEIDEILWQINHKRILLASGLQFNGDPLKAILHRQLPPAENMRNMTYDCKLEQEARSLFPKVCPDNGMKSEEPDKGYLLDETTWGTYYTGAWNKLSSIDIFGFSSFDMDQAVKFTDSDRNNLTTYANLMRAEASKIGCTIDRIGSCTITQTIGDVYPGLYQRVLFCVTDQKNIKDGDEIYKVGTPKAECNPLISEVDPSVATKAEFPGPEDGESGETSMCEWGGIPNTLRMNMLDTHNTRRELLALGQFTDNKGVTLPAAAKMNYLEWNCTLEKEAYEFLKSCPTEGYQRPNSNLPAQNFYRGLITEAEPTFRDMNKKTVTEWWKKGRKVNGPGKDLYFLLEHNSTEIKSFTLMGWGSTTQIGCSIAKCDDNWVEACRYYPPGNEPDEQMYTPGRACSQCASLGKICHNQKGLCK